MVARVRLWWKKIKQHRVAIGVGTIVLIVVIVLIIVEIRLYGTGFAGKTLWDWMQLLFIPVVLAIAGFWFNHRERKAAELRVENERKAVELRAEAEQEIAIDNQQETALQEYIKEMSELLLHEKLLKSQPEDEVRKIAQVLTFTILPRLNGERKGSVLRFLHDANLLDDVPPIIDLHHADLRGAQLKFANLHGADLSGADLSGANLELADLSDADLEDTNFRDANLLLANLKGTYRSPDD